VIQPGSPGPPRPSSSSTACTSSACETCQVDTPIRPPGSSTRRNRQTSTARLHIRGADHFFGEVDPNHFAGRFDTFRGRKQHRAATASNVEHTLAVPSASLLHQALTEIPEAGWPDRIVFGSQPIEHRSDLRLSGTCVDAHC
jgi:hypothetical protein